MSESFRLILSNSVALINFFLLIYTWIQRKKEGMLRLRIFSMLLTVGVYIAGEYYSALASVLFSILRDFCTLRMKGRKGRNFILPGIVTVLGTLFTVLQVVQEGGDWQDFLPAVSFFSFSVGQSLAKDARQMRMISAVDVLLFWLVYDFTNMLVVCVVQDLFLLLLPFAIQYVELDRELSPDAAETEKMLQSGGI